MSDLSKRLRGIGNECVALGYASLRHNYHEAADEIERLEARLVEQGDTISQLRIDRAEAERLLREAKEYMRECGGDVASLYAAIDAFLRPADSEPQP